MLYSKLGKGAFGDTYCACAVNPSIDVPKYVATKMQTLSIGKDCRNVLQQEATILKRMQRYRHVPRLYDYGEDQQLDLIYMVMEKQGENLLQLRKLWPHYAMPVELVLRIGVDALYALEGMHHCGYVNRDVKPSNFVVNMDPPPAIGKFGDRQQRLARALQPNVFMIDFGLARCYVSRSDGSVLDARTSVVGFRGTPKYASIHSHLEQDLGRRDDMWSLLYMIIELLAGKLPWTHTRDRAEIARLKKKFMDIRTMLAFNWYELDPSKYSGDDEVKSHGGMSPDCSTDFSSDSDSSHKKPDDAHRSNLPSCLFPFMQHLLKLDFKERPDYKYLRRLLRDEMAIRGFNPEAPVDWKYVIENQQQFVAEARAAKARAKAAAEAAEAPFKQQQQNSKLHQQRKPVTGASSTSSEKQLEQQPYVGRAVDTKSSKTPDLKHPIRIKTTPPPSRSSSSGSGRRRSHRQLSIVQPTVENTFDSDEPAKCTSMASQCASPAPSVMDSPAIGPRSIHSPIPRSSSSRSSLSHSSRRLAVSTPGSPAKHVSTVGHSSSSNCSTPPAGASGQFSPLYLNRNGLGDNDNVSPYQFRRSSSNQSSSSRGSYPGSPIRVRSYSGLRLTAQEPHRRVSSAHSPSQVKKSGLAPSLLRRSKTTGHHG
jgi:serine/threonine protein kinase